MHGGKSCAGCEECERKKESKKISISDAFLSKARYTKRPTYYTNIGIDRASEIGKQHASPSSFPEARQFSSSPLVGAELGSKRVRDGFFVPKSGPLFSSEGDSPRKIQKIESLSYGLSGLAPLSMAREAPSQPVHSKKVIPVPLGNAFSFNGTAQGDLWDIDITKRVGDMQPGGLQSAGGEGDFLKATYPDYAERESPRRSEQGFAAHEQEIAPIRVMGQGLSHGADLSSYAEESPLASVRMYGAGMGGREPQQKRSPSATLLNGQGSMFANGLGLHGGVGSFPAPDSLSYLSANTSASSCSMGVGSEDSGGGFRMRTGLGVHKAAGASFSGESLHGSATRTAYNPLQSTVYHSAQTSQLKHAVILSTAILPLIDFTLDPMKQHAKLNKVLGLPRLLPHNFVLTKNIMDLVFSSGGLQAVDEKNLWEDIVKELGQKAEDTHKLRMYYVIVCYPYEQVVHIANAAGDAPNTIIAVYIEPKKADILPEIINILEQKKRRTEAKCKASAKIVETSGILEVSVVLNEMYVNGVRTNQELIEAMAHLKGATCTSVSMRSVFSCLEVALIEKQLRTIMTHWISKRVEEVSSKEIPEIEKKVIRSYEAILADTVERCIAQMKGQKGLSGEEEGSGHSEDAHSILKVEKMVKSKIICLENCKGHTSAYAYPSIDMQDSYAVRRGACVSHSHCAVHQNIFCPCGKTRIKFDAFADIYYSALLFLGKSSTLHVSEGTAPLLAVLLETLPLEMLSFKYKYVYKAMLTLWNVLKEDKARGVLADPGAGARLLQPGFAKISKKVAKLLSSPILSKPDIMSVISNGQLEIILKIANMPGGHHILSQTRMQRLSEIWRYLLSLVCSGFFIDENAHLLNTALVSLDGLSVYLQKHLAGSDELQAVLNRMDMDCGAWVLDVLEKDVFADSVYMLCNFLFSKTHTLNVACPEHVLL
ncbi:hypothetical protein NEAUS06_1063 [Nematocida ausubeli]|nr:hypothetical protein NEAUS06_1063 [Nematocida ausubeli]